VIPIFNSLGYDILRDDYNNGHDFKRKSNKENKDNALKNENKTDDNINSNMDNVDIEEKKKNKLFKSFINFFTKISNKIDNLTGLDDDGHDNHKVGNKENINDNIDEHFINYLNIRYNNSNNQKNSKKEFNKYKKQDKVNYEKNITDKEININDFHIKKDKTHKYNDGLVFLRNLKKINKFSKDEDVHDKKTKQFFSANDYLIKNKEIDEDFKNNSDKNIFNEKKINLRDLFKLNKKNFNKIKNRIVTDEETKTLMGAAIFGLILIIIASSSYYFFFYQPFQEELNSVKIAKLNELNSIYKGPLALDNEAFTLKSQIENANSPEEIKTIDIIRPATESWRYYHNKEINIVKDDFNRVMVTYTANKTKNIITDVDSAHKMVADNDALVLANMEFKKPNTVVIPILITRLQAGAGLISVGSIVDIYILKSDNNNNSPSSSNSDNGNGTNLNSPDSYANQNLLNNENNEDSSILDEGPDISGVTVLAIMRSKDSGSIDANYIKTKINANGIITNQIENSQSFSTDVEEMLRGAIAGGFNEALIAQLLDKYGLKLADYERRSNLAELDIQYLLLIEVPRTDVSYTINNMDNLILTIPTEHAPNWMIDELKSTYA
jgi:hypothetical protein